MQLNFQGFIMKRIKFIILSVVLTFCFLAVLSGFSVYSQEVKEYKIITGEELLKKIEKDGDIVIIDCRPPEEYKEGHIPGAKNVSIDSYTFRTDTKIKAEMERILKQVNKEIDFILIDGESEEEYMPKTKMKELVGYLPEDRNKEIIFYCRKPTCTRSPMAARWAAALGYRNVYRYRGSWEDWTKNNYPVVKEN